MNTVTGRYGCPLPEHKHLRFATLAEKRRHIRTEHPKPKR